MAKIITKSDKFTPFGGLFFIINDFKRFVMPHVDSYLGLRCRLFGYQYSEGLLTMACNFFSGGDRISGDGSPCSPLFFTIVSGTWLSCH